MRKFVFASALLTLAACGRHHGGGVGGGNPDQTPDPVPTATPTPAVPLAPPPPANTAAADFRGFSEIDRLVRERMATNSFQLRSYLIDMSTPPDNPGIPEDDSALPNLLGFNTGDGMHSSFQNGKANALNFVLWHMALSGVAKDLASTCGATAPTSTIGEAVANSAMEAKIKPLCAWPDKSARTRANLQGLWATVMEDDAPAAEEEAAFESFALGHDLDALKGQDAVSTLLVAMMMNPHFLVRPGS